MENNNVLDFTLRLEWETIHQEFKGLEDALQDFFDSHFIGREFNTQRRLLRDAYHDAFARWLNFLGENCEDLSLINKLREEDEKRFQNKTLADAVDEEIEASPVQFANHQGPIWTRAKEENYQYHQRMTAYHHVSLCLSMMREATYCELETKREIYKATQGAMDKSFMAKRRLAGKFDRKKTLQAYERVACRFLNFLFTAVKGVKVEFDAEKAHQVWDSMREKKSFSDHQHGEPIVDIALRALREVLEECDETSSGRIFKKQDGKKVRKNPGRPDIFKTYSE